MYAGMIGHALTPFVLAGAFVPTLPGLVCGQESRR